MKCKYCEIDIPEGSFCALCGGAQHAAEMSDVAKQRQSGYAAFPGEHLLHPEIVSTLFPHLLASTVRRFRWALVHGVLVIFVLYLLGLITPAVILAALLVPTLYLMYLRQAQVFRDAPLRVLGATLGIGLLLGIGITLLTNNLVAPLDAGAGGVVPLRTLLAVSVLLPLLEEFIKPVPVLSLHLGSKFRETIDGLVFGVAAGLGYSVGQTFVRFWDVLTTLPLRTSPDNWIFPLLTLAVLLPVLQGTTTGMVCAAIWRFGRGHAGVREVGAVGAALGIHVAYSLGSQLILQAGFSQFAVLVWQVVVVGLILTYTRVLLHHSLLDEASDFGFAETRCPHCHKTVFAAGFCPQCGGTLTAVPRQIERPTIGQAPGPAGGA